MKTLAPASVVEVRLKSNVEEILDSLKSLNILIPKRSEVCEYLLNHPDIADILASVCEVTRKEFTEDTQLSLEMYSDPEIDYEYLTLYIRQEHYNEKILDKLRSVRSKHYEKLAGKSGRLLITTDFDNPR